MGIGWETGISLRDLLGGEGTSVIVVVEVEEGVVGGMSMAWRSLTIDVTELASTIAGFQGDAETHSGRALSTLS